MASQRVIKGAVNKESAIYSAAVIPVGGIALNVIKEPIADIIYGTTTGIISAPVNLFGNVIYK
jgi:hypothetical protein